MKRKGFETKRGEENNKATHIRLLLTLTAVRQRNDLLREGTEGLSLDLLRIRSVQSSRDQPTQDGRWGDRKIKRKGTIKIKG